MDLVIKAIEDALLVAYHKTDGAAAVRAGRGEPDHRARHGVGRRRPTQNGERGREYDDTPDGFGRIAATTAGRSSCSGCATPRTS